MIAVILIESLSVPKATDSSPHHHQLTENKSLERDTAFTFLHILKIYTTPCISSQAKALDSNTSSL